jgi:hypothetical protein
VQSGRVYMDRTKPDLLTGTPAKTERELDAPVKVQKDLKIECLAEIRNTRLQLINLRPWTR